MATNDVNSNYFSTASYSSKGMSGMMSGLDTENMVKQMLSGTQKKIDKQNALKQQTLWKQEFYRDMITSINSVRNKYFNTAFDASPVNNLSSSKFFNSMTSSVTSGSAVKVISTAAGSAAGDMRISVQQLAAAASLTSEQSIGADRTINGNADFTDDMAKVFNKTLNLQIGGTNGTAVSVDLNGINDRQAMLDKLNDTLAGHGITATVYDNKLRLISDQPGQSIQVLSSSNPLALSMTGFSMGVGSGMLDTGAGQMLQSGSNVNPSAGVSLTVNLDGVEKQITLNPESVLSGGTVTVTADAVKESLQKELDRTFGTGVVQVGLINDRFELGLDFNGEAGHSLTIYGVDANKLGIAPGASTRLSTSSKLSEVAEGERFTFTINGKEFSFSKNDTIGGMINKINTSNIGAQLSFSSVGNIFKLSSTSTGSKFEIEASQSEGNLLGAMFKTAAGDDMFASGGSAASVQLTANHIQGKTQGEIGAVNAESTFKINVDGVTATFVVHGDEGTTYSAGEIIDRVNLMLGNAYGNVLDSNGDPVIDTNGNQIRRIQFDGATGRLLVNDGSVVKFEQTTVDTTDSAAVREAAKTDIALALGLNTEAKSNIAGADTLASDVYQIKDFYDNYFTVAGGAAADANTKLSDLEGYVDSANGQSGSLGFSEGRLVLTADGGSMSQPGPIDLSGTTGGVDRVRALFGVDTVYDTAGGINAPTGGGSYIAAGKDALVTVNGIQTTRSNNLFAIDGVTIQAVAVTPAGGDDTVIGTQRDTESIITSVKAFIEDYNAMITKVTDYVTQEADYRDYAPLTPDQKKEMSEREIEMWEERAKTGLLRGDSTVNTFLNNLYGLLYTKPVSSPFAPYDIGIESIGFERMGDQAAGTLVFDEARFREALAADPGGVEALFTDPVNGLSTRMGAMMDSAAKTSLSAPGSLVSLAGIKGNYALDNASELNRILTGINDKLKDLQTKYERERDRYWKQFQAMEKAMANYQNQSNQIANMFYSGGA